MKESEEKIKKYLEEEYQLNDYELEVKDGWIIINTESDVNVPKNLEKLFPFEKVKFGKVGGNFSCEDCSSLLSLEGAPEKVGGDFSCFGCSSLTSLEGAPKKVGGDFSCSRCSSLTNLKGAPEKVGGDFSCSRCSSLTNLKGAPREVGKGFSCDQCVSLTSLESAPKEVSYFYCGSCSSLTSLEGAPEKVGGDFYCNNCSSLTSLKGSPKEVAGRFSCNNCSSLTSLKGAPEKVEDVFDCSDCSSLMSLEGAPEKVGGYFNCSNCSSLTSLKGAPKNLGDRMCSDMEYNSDFDEDEDGEFEDEDGEFESDEVDERLVYLSEILARFINQGGLELSDKDKDKLYKKVIKDAGFNSKLQDFKDELQKKIDMFEVDSDQLCDYERLDEIVNQVSYSMDVVPNVVEDVILADGKITINDIYELNHIMDAQEYHNEKRFIFYANFFEKVVEMAKKGKLKIVENN